jgi:hypothetical protein
MSVSGPTPLALTVVLPTIRERDALIMMLRDFNVVVKMR